MRRNRRDFLTTAAATFSIASAGRIACGAPESADSRVDTHLHCFAGAADARFPYHANGPYRPEESATPELLLRCMDEADVKFAVVVHPEPYQDDHRYLEHCLAVGQGRLKGTILLFADQPASVAKLPRLAKRGDIIAARIHAYAPDRLPPFGKQQLRTFWKQVADAGLALQLHFEPRYAGGFEPLIKEFSDTRVIIDHLGRPFQGTPAEHERVLRWADLDNTIIKLSSIPATDRYPHRDIGPVIKRLADAYGAERMIYGGGFGATATGESYRAAFQRGRSFIDHFSIADQAKVLGGNAIRLFGFGR